MDIAPQQALAFRAASQHLAQRLPLSRLDEAAAACGLQDTPPGSARLALAARVSGLRAGVLERALDEDRSLVTVHSVRGAPFLVPARDVHVFTLGAAPRTDEDLRLFLSGKGARSLAAAGIEPLDALDAVAVAASEALDKRVLTMDEFHEELRRRLPAELLPWCEGCQSNHVSSMLWRALGPRGVTCLAPRSGRQARFARIDQWLANATVPPPQGTEATELARCYLHCYGPSTPAHLAEWAGISPAQADAAWRSLKPELAAVQVAGTPAWVLRQDLQALSSPPEAEGVRLLPPSDPYLRLRDRATLAPGPELRKRIWQATGSPGAVLDSGRLAGLWRPRKKGAVLELHVEPLGQIDRVRLTAEAELVAAQRGCRQARLLVEA